MQMKGHGEKFGTKQHAAIVALLESQTLEEAAGKVGISPGTVSRWMKRDDFQAAYRKARREVFEIGLSRLQALSVDAVQALKRNLTCGRPMAEIRAASAILEHARHGAEILDVADRLAALESNKPKMDFSQLTNEEWQTFKALRAKLKAASG